MQKDPDSAETPDQASVNPTLQSGAGSGGDLRRFWRFSQSYWSGESRWEALGLTSATFLACLLQVLLQLRLNLWLREFFDTLEAHDWPRLIEHAIAFAMIVLAVMATGAWLIHARMSWQLSMRRWLTTRLIDRWLAPGRHYLLRFHDQRQDDPDYRIAEDAKLVTEATIDLAIGLFNSILAIAGFIGVLWSLSGLIRLTIMGSEVAVPGYLVFIALAYAGCGSFLTYLVGRPMVGINEHRHSREGDFRVQLVRVSENSEGIAFLRGEADERRGLERSLAALADSWLALIARQRWLTLLTTGYATLAPVLPLLAASPSFLAGDITLGGLMQAAAAFVQIQIALGFFVDNFARISDWRAGVNRMLAMLDVLIDIDAQYLATDETTIDVIDSPDRVLRFVDVHLDGPDGLAVIDQATVEIMPGERVLVIGESGAGKTTLVRAAAGLWPWGRGRIELPHAMRVAFMPERPYFPSGSLRVAIVYPDAPDSYTAEQLTAALSRCGLSALASRLDEEGRWNQALSMREQQLLGFARLLVHKPDCVFMDEATTALDEATLGEVMSLFGAELKGTTLVSVDHRPGLEAFHDRILTLTVSAEGGRLVRDEVPAAQHTGVADWLRRLFRP